MSGLLEDVVQDLPLFIGIRSMGPDYIVYIRGFPSEFRV